MFIYALIDPRDERVRYIGKAGNPQERLRQHLSSYSLKKRTPKNIWILDLLSKNTKPKMEIIRSLAPVDDWQAAERDEIQNARSNGCDLLNSTDGGEGFGAHTEMSRKNISRAQMGNKFSLGHKHSANTIQKMSLAGKGKTRSDETKERMRIVNQGESNNRGAKLTNVKVLEIREKYASGLFTQSELGQQYDIHQHTVSCIVRKKYWSHI